MNKYHQPLLGVVNEYTQGHKRLNNEIYRNPLKPNPDSIISQAWNPKRATKKTFCLKVTIVTYRLFTWEKTCIAAEKQVSHGTKGIIRPGQIKPVKNSAATRTGGLVKQLENDIKKNPFHRNPNCSDDWLKIICILSLSC